jgi:hypothetical protein
LTPDLRQSVHDDESAANHAVNFALTRRRSWAILLAGSVAQVVLFYGVGLVGQTSRYLGIPGAAAALIGVVAAVVAGPVWLDISIRYLAGEGRLGIGGDFVDYVVHDDQGVSFVIGDVSGHGPDAAALGATLRSGWRALATAGVPLRQTLDSLDKVLFSERNSRNMYCTLLAGRIDGPTASLTLSNAGSLDEVLAELQQANGKPLPDDVAALLISTREAGKPGSQSYHSVEPALQRSG